jgi:hypothetical protein
MRFAPVRLSSIAFLLCERAQSTMLRPDPILLNPISVRLIALVALARIREHLMQACAQRAVSASKRKIAAHHIGERQVQGGNARVGIVRGLRVPPSHRQSGLHAYDNPSGQTRDRASTTLEPTDAGNVVARDCSFFVKAAAKRQHCCRPLLRMAAPRGLSNRTNAP